MTWVAGVDGFKNRWCAILHDLEKNRFEGCVISTFAELLTLDKRPAIIAVDIPIGLPETAMPGGRACERQSRAILGGRKSSVFTAVGRNALKAERRDEADRLSRAAGGIGIGAQAWGLSSKLREADAAMSSTAQQTVREVHPEVCFWALNHSVPMSFAKKSKQGQLERREALIANGFSRDFVEGMASELKVGRDDFLDACAAVWTAKRIASDCASRFPADPDLDMRGLDQAIWF